VKGKAGLPRSRHTGTNWKAVFVLLRKLGHWSKGSECNNIAPGSSDEGWLGAFMPKPSKANPA
jgi:hypothetical protein